MGFRNLKKRFNLWLINKLRPFKYSRFKSKLFNKIPGCKIGKNSIIVGPLFINGCSLIVGDNVHIGHDLKCEGNGFITIGDNCDIGPNVTLLTGSHEIGDKNRRAGKGKTLRIDILNSNWIGANCVILGSEKGLRIGPSSVIGCASNVVKDVGENEIVGGNPAKLIKKAT